MKGWTLITISVLLAVTCMPHQALSKDCWATASLSIDRAGGAIEQIGTLSPSEPPIVQLFPGDEAFLTYEGTVEWSCPDARITLQLNGSSILDHPAGSTHVVQLTEAGFYLPGVAGGGFSGIYLNYGGPFFLTFTSSSSVLVSAKAWLEGPYDGTAGLMHDQMRTAGLVPLTNSSSSTTAGVMALTGPNAVVDWVSVALRVSTASDQTVGTRQALIQRDGDIVGMDGSSPLSFAVPAGNYHVLVRHRNHLGAITANTIPLSSTPTVVDFRSAALTTYGTDARKTVGTQRILWAGKAANPIDLKRVAYTGNYNDRDPILVKVGSTTPNAAVPGYFKEDANLDGVVKYTGTGNDRDLILQTIGGSTPNAVRAEQIPVGSRTFAGIGAITRKDLDRLAVPAIISGIAEPIIALSDTHFAGRIGPHDLAAVGIGSSFFLLVLWVLAQTRSAVLAIVARYYGEGRVDEVRDLVSISIWMNVGLGLFFYSVTVPLASWIFTLYNPDPVVLEKAAGFFRLRAVGFPIALSVFAMTGAFRGIQNMRWSMWISMGGAMINLALNPLLIFGWGPVQAMGINGSAVASVIAQASMLMIALYVMLTRTPFRLFPDNSWHHRELVPLVRNSGNLFARTIALNACYFFGNRFASGYGVAYIGAHSIAMQIWLFSAFFIDGYAAAGSVIAGRLNGERDWKQMHRVSWQVVRVTVYIGGGLALLYTIGYSWIGGWFTQDAEVLALFQAVFWMVILTQPINAVAFAWDGIYKGIAAGVELRNALIVATFGVFIPTVFIGDHFGWKLHGVWLAFLLWMILRGAWLSVSFERRYARFLRM